MFPRYVHPDQPPLDYDDTSNHHTPPPGTFILLTRLLSSIHQQMTLYTLNLSTSASLKRQCKKQHDQSYHYLNAVNAPTTLSIALHAFIDGWTALIVATHQLQPMLRKDYSNFWTKEKSTDVIPILPYLRTVNGDIRVIQIKQ
jgi:hypothetical protein